MNDKIDVSIITPSRNMLNWLKLCHRSVADQRDVTCEHIVQDAQSTDGTVDWLKGRPDILWNSESDSGMYDAVNKGLLKAKGDILAYLNCDEQYLPGTLKAVLDFFKANPHVEILFGDVVVVNDRGEYICSREVLLPEIRHTVVSHLNTMSCAMFFRRSLIERNLMFDPAYKNIGDTEWIARLLDNNVVMAGISRFLSAFTETGVNWGMDRSFVRTERAKLMKQYPRWWRILGFFWTAEHRWLRFRAGMYSPGSLSYSIHTQNNENDRTNFVVDQPVFLWKSRLRLLK